MPVCPKCKNEYREGFTVCAECKCDLVDSLETAQVENIEQITDGIEQNVVSKELLEAYIKKLEEAEKEDASPEADECPKKKVYKTGVYRNSAEQAEDNKSSAWTLLSVGVVGIIVLVLIMLEIIPVHLYGISKYMTYGVMFALFILFIVMGIVSLRNSKIFAKKAESESSLADTMKQWCMDNIRQDEIDETLFGTADMDYDNQPEADFEDVSDEVKYFKRSEELKRLLSDKFMNLDEGFLEEFVDQVYEDIFEE